MAATARIHPSLLLPRPFPLSTRASPSVRVLVSTPRVEGLRLRCPIVSPRGRAIPRRRVRASDSTHGDAATVEEETAVEENSGVEVLDNDAQSQESSEPASVVMASLQSYRAAVANNDQGKIAEIESFLQSIQDEKDTLAAKLALLSLDSTSERDRVLRISADFENFRKRTERERLNLMTNVQGEVLEKLLPVLDNFERAKDQIKIETESEEKINTSYQSIYKQFSELLKSLGVEAVQTVGQPFDPMLHEAIMREESTEFEEGAVLQEFRKGYKLRDRLLRPAMVKVSAGPGPAKGNDQEAIPEEVDKDEKTGSNDASNGEAA